MVELSHDMDFELIKYTEYSEILKGEALDEDFWPLRCHVEEGLKGRLVSGFTCLNVLHI